MMKYETPIISFLEFENIICTSNPTPDSLNNGNIGTGIGPDGWVQE